MRSVDLLRHIVDYTYGGDTELSLHLGDDLTELSYEGYARQSLASDQWEIEEMQSGEGLQIAVTLNDTVAFEPNRAPGISYDRVGIWSNGALRYVFRLEYPVDISPTNGVIKAPSFLPGSLVNVEMQ